MPETLSGSGAVDTMSAADIDRELAGLDALELAGHERKSLGSRTWSATWPKLIAIGLVIGGWELVSLSNWKSDHILPGPRVVLGQLWTSLTDGTYFHSDVIPATLQRAAIGYLAAVLIGTVVGATLSQIKLLRTGVASLITGLQTMPSVLWYPAALVLFGLNDNAILFVVIIGAAPSVAAGIMSGADQVHPLLLRAGRVLGANKFQLWRQVVFPASMPAVVSGLKQGWAFAWRSLMAGELLGASIGKGGIGGLVDNARTFSDYNNMYAAMTLILIFGVIVDAIFNVAEKNVNRRRGLIDVAGA
ncbi:MAG: ABC transporter permease [Acidimicrobiia bacterium]|nr:ABC transporter permease [Acidimicrobiia bacterium]